MFWNPFRQLAFECVRRRLSEPVARRLLEGKSEWPCERVVSVAVVRIAQFEDVAKRLSAEGVQRLMDDFFWGVADATYGNRGSAECAMGSRIQSVYGEFPDSGTPDDAVRSVLQMLGRAAVGEPVASLADLRRRGIHISAGVATGLCVFGDFGGEQRRFFLTVGEAVERAHALCGMAQPETLLIDEATLAHLRQAEPDWAGRAVPHHDEVGGEAAYRL